VNFASTLEPWTLTTAFLLCGVAAPLIFIAVFLTEGTLRKNYSPWRHYVSSLSLGNRGWIQILNFVLCGTGMIAFSMAIYGLPMLGRSRFLSGSLFLIFGIGLVASGIFPTDAAMGYPEGTKDLFPPRPPSRRGQLHGLAGLAVFFLSLPIAALTMAWHFSVDEGQIAWGVYSALSGLMVPALFIASGYYQQLALLEIKNDPDSVPDMPVGLFQRLSIISGWTWISMLAYHLLKLAR
jgi:hypothetical protein